MTRFRITPALLLIICALLAAGCSTSPGSENTSQAIPHDRYVFVEHHVRTDGVTISGDCSPPLSIDFPMYSFDEKSGVLEVYVSSNTPVNESLKMVYGDGESLAGIAGGGASTWASPVYSLPYAGDNVTVESISGNGTVSLRYNQEPLILKPKERRVNITQATKTSGYLNNCTAEFVTTDSLYNSGFLDKGTIITRVLK